MKLVVRAKCNLSEAVTELMEPGVQPMYMH